MRTFVIPWFFLAVLLSSCQQSVEEKLYSHNGIVQGTYYSIKYYHTDSTEVMPKVLKAFQDINSSLSVYDTSSVVSLLNNCIDTKTDKHFLTVLITAIEIAKETEGAFDFTVGQLVSAWGFGFSNSLNMTQAVVDSLLGYTGFNKISVKNNSQVIKDIPQVRMDFNAIAKGYTVDIVSELLEAEGIRNYIVDIGGEVRAGGEKPGKQKWRVGVERPAKEWDSSPEIQMIVGLSNMSLATSGNYRKYYEKDGVRYAHTIDPQTGHPVKHSLLSVSVLASSCMHADAYATALMVMGLEKGMQFVNNKDEIEACFIYQDANAEMAIVMTEGFKQLLID